MKSLNRRVCFNFDERLVRTIVGPKHETYEAILSMLAKRPRRDARLLFSKKSTSLQRYCVTFLCLAASAHNQLKTTAFLYLLKLMVTLVRSLNTGMLWSSVVDI